MSSLRAASAAALLALALSSTQPSCSSTAEPVLIGGEKVAPEDIDKDPLALLPGGVVMLGYLDAPAMFQSGVGPDAAKLVSNLIPLGPESNFVPSRDVSKLYGGLYAMQGADFCVVAQGNFDRDAIERAADAKSVSVAGMAMVKSHYAGMNMYTVGNLGFVVLTSHTALSGNETGMRRALDRMRFSKLERAVPQWMVDLTATRGAAFVVAGDLTSQPGIEAAAASFPFVSGLKQVRVLGNFQPPGINFAGALTYEDSQKAAAGASSLQNIRSAAAFLNLVTSIFGGSVPAMQVAQKESEVAFTLPLDDRLVRLLLNRVVEATRPTVTQAH